jgi:hypothetical protein
VKIDRVSASKNHIVFSGHDGGFWQANLRGLDGSERICSVFYETPAAVAVGVKYHLLVVGTLEGSILLYSLTPGPFRMRGDLAREIPSRILITDGWGFIVAATSAHLLVFDVNERLLRSVDLTIRIVARAT